MKKIIALLFVLAASLPADGQSIQKRYASRMTPDGTIFFINPQKLGALTNIKRFEYDMTLLNWSDSVTVNFTFGSTSMCAPEDFRIANGEKTYVCREFSVLYTDIKKNYYEIRITSKFPVSELVEIIASPAAPVFTFTQEGVVKTAAYKKSDWQPERKKLSDILQLYHYSQK